MLYHQTAFFLNNNAKNNAKQITLPRTIDYRLCS